MTIKQGRHVHWWKDESGKCLYPGCLGQREPRIPLPRTEGEILPYIQAVRAWEREQRDFLMQGVEDD